MNAHPNMGKRILNKVLKVSRDADDNLVHFSSVYFISIGYKQIPRIL